MSESLSVHAQLREAAIKRDKFIDRIAGAVMGFMLVATAGMYVRDRSIESRAKRDTLSEAERDGFNEVNILDISHHEGTALLKLDLGNCALTDVKAELEIDSNTVEDISRYSTDLPEAALLGHVGGAGGLHGLRSRTIIDEKSATVAFRNLDELKALTRNNPCQEL